VLRTSKCPVWIARRPVRLPIVRFVVATDLSDAGQAALDTAAVTIEAFGPSSKRMDVVLLHVVHPDLERALLERLGRKLEDQAAGWALRHNLADTVHFRPVMIKAKDPARGVLSYLRRHNTDLLVIGTHGRSTIDRLLIGSVAAQVLRACPCDALAVPPRRAPRGKESW
jgi:nucleotide-binding universal stress UspA family protein